MKSDFLIAVTQLAAERNLPREMVISAVEAALVSAYKKDTPSGSQNIKVHLDPNTGDVTVWQLKTVVEEVENEAAEMTLEEAKAVRNGSDLPEIGDVLEFELQPQVAGRIAAQTAKQVVIQRLREAERELVFNEFSEREGEVFNATVQRSEARYGGTVTLDLNGRASAVLPPSEQVQTERYRPAVKMKVMILEVTRTTRGPEIIVTRSHPDLVRRLFEMEVPEIFNGIVEIRGIAREAGSRSKVAVMAKQDGIDPVGACVGLRGIRIQNIVNELQGEKIDVIQWSRDPATFISHSLSPAQPLRVELDTENNVATVIVPDRQLSLAIGREGQNARLAAKLTGWKVDIKSVTEVEIERMKRDIEGHVAERAAAAAVEAEAVASGAEPAIAAEAVPAETTEAPEPAIVEAAAEVAKEPAVAAPGDKGLTPEELLLLEAMEEEERRSTVAPVVEEVEEEEVEEFVTEEEDIWRVPEPIGGGPQVRFAEDILGGPSRRGGRRRKGGRRRGGQGDALEGDE